MDTRTIMIVEDDREIRALLADLLTREGYAPVCVENGAAMDRALMQACPDLIVLDIMLPGEDGLSICQRLRSKSRTPILMLTAKADDVDRIIGLELGADDYLPKPFNPRELLARIKAVLRRVDGPLQMPPPRRIAFGRLVADLDGRSLTNDQNRVVELTAAEFDLLACFLERPSGCCPATSCSTGHAAGPRIRSTASLTCRLAGCAASSSPRIPRLRSRSGPCAMAAISSVLTFARSEHGACAE